MFTVKQVRECDSHNGQKVHESLSIRFSQIERFEHFDMNCSWVGDSNVLRQVEVSNLFFQQSNLSTSIQMVSNGENHRGESFWTAVPADPVISKTGFVPVRKFKVETIPA